VETFPYSHTNKRYHTFDHFARTHLGAKAARIPLDARMTCPNKDGRCGVGGCLFCAGGSSGAVGDSIEEQYRRGVETVENKWGGALRSPYLQGNTNTDADTDTDTPDTDSDTDTTLMEQVLSDTDEPPTSTEEAASAEQTPTDTAP